MSVRYSSGDNTDLKFALWIVWDRRCYWRKHVIDSEVLEIDHIVSQQHAAMDAKSDDPVLPDGFDVHAVGNLAPICRDCNGGKGGGDFTMTGWVVQMRSKAKRLAPKVEAEVASMKAEPNLVRALRTVINVRDANRRAAKLIKTQGGAVMQRMYDAGARLVLAEEVELPAETLGGFDMVTISTMLSEDSRITRVILADVCGVTWDGLLLDVAGAVADDVVDEVLPEIMRQVPERVGEPDAYVDRKRLALTVTSVTRKRLPDALEVEVIFDVAAEVVADVSVVGIDGTGLDDFTGEGAIESACSLVIVCDLDTYGPVEVTSDNIMFSRSVIYTDVS
ncbi:HNH endonuclease [uncultured Pseudokineococcus sp.]|uniref:HNH endonuclease n=1 Tax=uncultured Pseudokineococcus sp. TaxID=1642928 RepID=UPI0026049D03|nr:hypothetical protein [uncultured Pseudokineococcus sp.]